ncbi:MAG: ABC transporter permease [Tannerella sp.]|jgi:ABC-type antimicrobial peptide transport system permease subunit|nr:ABC transporter permease [Tannerella sp.]
MFYHLKIMVRNLRRGGFYSAINIVGLAIGMAAAVLLLIWVYNQWSYDRFHPKAKQIHQVWSRNEIEGVINCWQATSLMIGPALKDEYPEIVESVRVFPGDYLFGEGDRSMTAKTTYADPSFLTMFNFPLLYGDANTALNDPYSIILTEKTAKWFFGDENPMGKTLMYNMKEPVTVTGVMRDLPDNTRFNFEILGHITFREKVIGYSASWGNMGPQTYVELTPYAQLDRLNASICDIIKRNTDQRMQTEAFLYPLDKSYLYNKFENGVPSAGVTMVIMQMFIGIAVFLLLIACINFVNLSTARSSIRAKEVGVRKALGSKRSGLIGLFISESMMLAFISGIIALVFVIVVLPEFSALLGGFAGRTLSVNLFDFRFWLFALVFILLTGLLAGAYPAFVLSAFNPVKVLKGAVAGGGSRITVRKVLVVLQFSFAIFLIIGTLVVRRQIIHAKNRDAGYDKELLIYIPLPEGIANHYSAFRYDLISSGAIKDMTRTWMNMMNMWASTSSPEWRGKNPEDNRNFNLFFADGNWAKMMGAEVVMGRFPDAATFSTDSSAILINETAARMIGFEDPIGEKLSYWGYEGHITTVIKDFVLHNPFEKPQPMVIGCEKGGFPNLEILIRLTQGKTADRLATLENSFKQYSAGYPFRYQFVDDDYALRFKTEQAVEALTGAFTVIAILLSCMGLFALTALTVERRRKEIGIRKVLGASVTHITMLVSKEYLVLTIIAFALSAPLAWFVMHQFLNMYDYRTNIPVWLIVGVGILILLIAILTVGFHAIKAAMANPVDAIKSE